MNIQLAEEYRNAEKGGNGAWVFGQSEPGLERRSWSQGSREEGHLEPGLKRRSRSWGPELGRWSRSRGLREEGCSKEYEHEEEEGLKRT